MSPRKKKKKDIEAGHISSVESNVYDWIWNIWQWFDKWKYRSSMKVMRIDDLGSLIE